MPCASHPDCAVAAVSEDLVFRWGIPSTMVWLILILIVGLIEAAIEVQGAFLLLLPPLLIVGWLWFSILITGH
jgi:hypothetical protein